MIKITSKGCKLRSIDEIRMNCTRITVKIIKGLHKKAIEPNKMVQWPFVEITVFTWRFLHIYPAIDFAPIACVAGFPYRDSYALHRARKQIEPYRHFL